MEGREWYLIDVVGEGKSSGIGRHEGEKNRRVENGE